MYEDEDQSAWSLYWSEDRLYSCVAQASESDQKVLNELWKAFAATLDDNSKVLDLATGNGAVASALLAAQTSLQIDAVDKATIDPNRYLSNSNLQSVSFHADTDILAMSFEPSSFDAITSQFGIEYAGFSKACASVMPYLKNGGRFQYIVHHADSDIILSSKQKIIELEQLAKENGLLDTLIKVLRGDADFTQLETLGKAYLKAKIIRTEAISGQAFIGIERIASNFVTRPKESLELGVAMNLRMRSELTRLRQLVVAGQTLEEMERWSGVFASQFDTDVEFKSIYVDHVEQDYLLGWLVSGQKSR